MREVRSADEMDALLASALTGGQTLLPLAPDDPFTSPDQPTNGAAVVIATSGSTGRPKLVALSTEALLASAAATREHLGGPMNWVSPLPFQYVASVMTQVRAHEAGTRAVRCRTDLSDLTVPTEPTAISLVPTQLRRALDHPDHREILAHHAVVLLGGAAADPTLLATAKAAGITVITTYGMSETCGGCVYDGQPLPGVQVTIDDDHHRIWLAGPMLFDGYLGEVELTTETLVDGRLRTHDRGQWNGDRLQVLGRLDEVVISGGVNIDLAALNRTLEVVTGGRAVALGAPHPHWGTAVVVFTDEPGQGDQLLADYKARLLAAGIDRLALPKAVIALVGLPRLASGKIDRQALLARTPGLFQED